MDKKKLFLLDAYALIYRSYYAFIKNPRITTTGINTSAVLGFCNFLLELIELEQPTHLAVVFDPSGPTFRHKMYEPYKAQRPPMPEDLRASIPYIKRIIAGLGITLVEEPGFEADDVIGTLAKQGEKDNFTVYMITPDKDYAQLVSDQVFMYKPGRGGEKSTIWGVSEVLDSFGIERVDQVIDILGLMGDTADNVPGCAGIGPKSASKLINSYGDIPSIYDHIEELKGKQKESLIQCRPTVMLSRELVTICTTVPTETTPNALERRPVDRQELDPIFRELELFSVMKRVNSQSNEQQDEAGDVEAPVIKGREVETTPMTSISDKELKALLSNKELGVVVTFGKGGYRERQPEHILLSAGDGKCSSIAYPKGEKEEEVFLYQIKKIVEKSGLTLVCDETKELLGWLLRYNITPKAALFDVKVAHYLINPEVGHDVARMVLEYFGHRLGEESGVVSPAGGQLSLFDEPQAATVNAMDAARCEALVPLKEKLLEVMKRDHLDQLFQALEMPLTSVLARMEFEGVAIDEKGLKGIADKLNGQIETLSKGIFQEAGCEFNISSPKQLSEVLYDKMGIESGQKKTKSGQLSTSEQVLSKLAEKHPIVELILEYRGLKKLVGTYAEALPGYVDPVSGRIHPSFNQTETATGRLSCVNPNLQNIPIRSEEGREIRKAFVTGVKDTLFLSADYSQVELRLMAHLSGDPALIEAFRNEEDVHTATAAKIFKVPTNEVTEEMRRRAKTANFGIIYGISSWGLAERLNISRKEGKELIDGYFEHYPKVKAYMEQAVEQARKQEYVETLMGRRRYLRDINSRNAIVRGVAERNAVNAPIQGSAADIIKKAMIDIDTAIREQGLKSRMILQVHDELNFICYKDEEKVLRELVIEKMENAVKLEVPLTVSCGEGDSWFEAH